MTEKRDDPLGRFWWEGDKMVFDPAWRKWKDSQVGVGKDQGDAHNDYHSSQLNHERRTQSYYR